jgi:RNA polymerase sigma-70 factor (ECF subfamily)
VYLETLRLSHRVQLLTPQQRAALILRDVLGWSAKEAAELLELSVAAANSALQRARSIVRTRIPPRRPAWPAGVDAGESERELLRKYVAGIEQSDVSSLVSLIAEDAVFRMPPSRAHGPRAIFRLMATGDSAPRSSAGCAAGPPAPTGSPPWPATFCGGATRPTARWPSTSSGSKRG